MRFPDALEGIAGIPCSATGEAVRVCIASLGSRKIPKTSDFVNQCHLPILILSRSHNFSRFLDLGSVFFKKALDAPRAIN